jgi:hypothetical protein
MSQTNNTAKQTQKTVSEAVVSAKLVAVLEAKKEELRLAKEAAAFREEDEKHQAQNSCYVPGSLRRATDTDKAVLVVHNHGKVGEIRCAVCGKIRLVNAQDIFQVTCCKEHVKEAKKEAQKAKLAAKRAAKKDSKESVEAQIAKLNKKLAELSGTPEVAAVEVVAPVATEADLADGTK